MPAYRLSQAKERHWWHGSIIRASSLKIVCKMSYSLRKVELKFSFVSMVVGDEGMIARQGTKMLTSQISYHPHRATLQLWLNQIRLWWRSLLQASLPVRDEVLPSESRRIQLITTPLQQLAPIIIHFTRKPFHLTQQCRPVSKKVQ